MATRPKILTERLSPWFLDVPVTVHHAPMGLVRAVQVAKSYGFGLPRPGCELVILARNESRDAVVLRRNDNPRSKVTWHLVGPLDGLREVLEAVWPT